LGASVRVAVTGAFGFSGRYIAQRLLALQHEVITHTNSPDRPNPFGGSIKAFPYNFSEPHELQKSLCGVDVLMNTYWVRFDNPPHFTFAQAIANSKVLFDAAKSAGVGRLVHISITNPDPDSPLPYFRGKAEIEDHLRHIGIPYAILRPAVLFGREDILINNIAWALRHLPLFGIYGAGRYRVQPIYVGDLAGAAVDQISRGTNETIDAIGPETYSYRELVQMIAREIGSHGLIVSMPPIVAYQAVRVLGWLVGDVINTRDEVRGLMQEKLYVRSHPLGTTKLSDWVRASRQDIGRRYASELQRRLDRSSAYS
jgi:NADH dehydrogenase